MKKRIVALVLALGMSVQMTGIVQAQAMEDNPADVPEVSYVIMAEDADEVQEVTGTEIQEEDSIETGDGEIVAVELTEEEAEALEKLDVVIEEDIPFSASALNDGNPDKASGFQDASETAQEPGTAQEAGGETTDNPADTQTSQDTDSLGNTEGQEDIDSPEEPEGPGNTEELDISEGTGKPGTSEETKQPEEPGEKEESEVPEEPGEADVSEEAEEAESSKEIEEPETAEDGEGQRTQKEEARDDWNLAAVHADTYAKEEASGEPVKIAVLDSGVNYRESLPVYGHETELKGMESNPFFEDATGHGTAVASLIASSPDGESIRGINKDAEVYSVQVLDADNSGTLSGVVQGIYWAIENDMDIINMSFGTPHPSEILEKAVKDAEEAGILLVAAAGNDADSAVSYPAAYDGVCAVGSSSPNGEIAADSTRGEDVDIYAPGETVMVNAPLFGTQIEGGSSLACAQVSGAASLLWEKDRTKDAQFIRALLEGTANSGIDPEYGRGLLDVEQAAEEFDSFVPEMKETEEEQVQEKPLPEFDEAELRALWGSSAHKAMITSGVGGYKTMYAAAAYPDSGTKETNPLKRDRRFHGVGHYLLTMKFLVNLAHEYYLKDDGNWQEVYQWADSDSRILKENKSLEEAYEKKYGYKCEINMVKEIKGLLNQRIRTDISAAEENTRHNKAYKIMGVAIHLAGDIYAHRSRVTPAMLENAKSVKSIKNEEEAKKKSEQYRNAGYFVKEDFKNWEKFVKDVKNGVVNKKGKRRYIEFRHLTGTASPNGRYLKENIKIGNQTIKGNQLYEDNPKIQKWRYSDARSVVEDLIGSNTDYNFRTHKWNVKVMRSLHRLRGSKITN